jgi:hypothetical protein
MRDVVDKLQQSGMRVCAVYLIDSQVRRLLCFFRAPRTPPDGRTIAFVLLRFMKHAPYPPPPPPSPLPLPLPLPTLLQFAVDASKFLSACMQCLSTMVMLELPHINVLSKMDLVTRNKRHMRKFLDCNRFLLRRRCAVLQK